MVAFLLSVGPGEGQPTLKTHSFPNLPCAAVAVAITLHVSCQQSTLRKEEHEERGCF